MKFLVFILTSFSCLAQGPFSTGVRQVATLQAMNPVLYPTQVVGLKLWLSADFGCYTNTSGTPCTHGSKVAQWKDQSGNGTDVGNDTVGRQPKYFTNMINGLPAIGFLGGTVILLTNTFPNFVPQPTTYFAVFFASNTAGTQIMFDGLASPERNTVGFIAALWTAQCESSHVMTYARKQPLTWCQETFVFYTNKSRMFNNSKPVSASLNMQTNGVYGLTIGDSISLASQSFGGLLAELVMFGDRIITDTERRGIEMYLKRKYALEQPF